MTATSETAAVKPGGGLFGETVEMAKTLGAGLLIALALRVIVFQPNTIPSSSMEPGVVTGDYIIVSKWPYGWSRASVPFNPPLPAGRLFGRDPARGDVVVFRLPRDTTQVYIKRLIGLPGDRVQVTKGQVFVNGRPLARRFTGWTDDHDAPGRIVPRTIESAPTGRQYVTYGGAADGEGDNTGVYVVPAGHYFMMGDNRDNSLDSRWPRAAGGVDFVPAEDLIGRAEAVAVSWKEGASIFRPWTWLNLDWGRFFVRLT